MNAHDERRIPFTLPDPDPSLLDVLRAGIRRLLGRRNHTDSERQAVRVSNKALRMQQVRRALNQPGLSPEQRELEIKRILR